VEILSRQDTGLISNLNILRHESIRFHHISLHHCLDLPCAMLQRKRKGLPRTPLLPSSKTPDRMWREWSVYTLCIFFVLGKDLWWHYCSEKVSRLYSWLPYRMSLCRRSCEGRLNLCRWGGLLRIGDKVEAALSVCPFRTLPPYQDNNGSGAMIILCLHMVNL